MTTFVSGVTGYLGRNVLDALLESRREINALVRSKSKIKKWPEQVKIIEGDIRNDQDVRKAMNGCQEAIHMAALMKMSIKGKKSYEEINLGGLKNAIAAAKEVGIKKFLNISCFIALGPTDGQIVNEKRLYKPDYFHNDYERSKWLADQYAIEMAKTNFPIIHLYPGMIYGEGEITSGNLIGEIALAFMKGKTFRMFHPLKRQCLSYISDVANGFIRVLERGKIGERYILGGENITIRELFKIFHEITGEKMPQRRPVLFARMFRWWCRWRAEILGIEPDIVDEAIEIFTHDWAYSSEKAIQELGYTITPVREGMKKMFEGLLKTRL